MTDLLDYQFAYRGLTIGDQTSYDVAEVEGLEGFDSRTNDEDLPRTDGASHGQDYVTSRTFVLTVEMAGTEGTLQTQLAELKAAFRPERSELYDFEFKLPNTDQQLVRARPIKFPDTKNWRNQLYRQQSVVLVAPDPRIYGATVTTLSVPLYQSAGAGIDMPITNFGVDWGATTGSEAQTTNAGNAQAFPLVQFYGPTSGTCTAVKLTNRTNGDVLDIQTTLLSGQILVADMEAVVTAANRTPVHISGASRYSSWQQPRDPLALEPGDNLLRFEITGTSTNVQAVVTYRDTWIS